MKEFGPRTDAITDDLLEQGYRTHQALKGEMIRSVVIDPEALMGILGAVAIDAEIILDGEPGVGKTKTALSLAGAMGGTFKRIQGTPDKLPRDITGTERPVPGSVNEFEFKKGPLFANVVLVDEINRIMPKSQSALLEAMQERRVTIGDETHKLPETFLLLATHNPAEKAQGTYPLTKANIDRFAVGITMDSDPEREARILDMDLDGGHETRQVVEEEDILNLQDAVEEVAIDGKLRQDLRAFNDALKNDAALSQGSQMSGSRKHKQLANMARAVALGNRREVVESSDIATAARVVLPHRLEITRAAAKRDVTPRALVEDMIARRLS